MSPARIAALALLAFAAGCTGEKDAAPERKTAAGEVLGGSISDAMLPLDTVQSQSPPLGNTGEADDGSADTPAKAGKRSKAETQEPEAAPSGTASAGASASASPQAEN